MVMDRSIPYDGRRSPRELLNSVHVGPGRYVNKDPKQKRAICNDVGQRSRMRQGCFSGGRFYLINVDSIA